MVDMGQADATLRRKPLSMQHKMCWTRALAKAAQAMGYSSFMEVPDAIDEELRQRARAIQVQ